MVPLQEAMTRLCRVKQFMGNPCFTFPVGPASSIVLCVQSSPLQS